jgi:endonuclease/exonuclease/phosphatase family metal-dependent hydrolase
MTSQLARSLRRRSLLAIIVVVLAVLLPAGVAQAGGQGGPKLTVMTRNLYLGTGLTNTVGVGSLGQLVAAVTQDWANVLATDFPTRAGALADEIADAHPDVVGLQEVTLWRDQTPSDIVSPTPVLAPNATNVVLDFLAILQGELAARGLPYTAVSTSTNADAEAPRLGDGPTGFVDLRITDRDVILVRDALAAKFSNPQNGNYTAALVLPSFAGNVVFTRGWASIDYRHDARTTVRIFDTHLEVESPAFAAAVQVLQGSEALAIIAASPYPVVALGDFNSPATGLVTPTYGNLTAVLDDAWVTAQPSDPGLTCCQNELLSNPVDQSTNRIDLILTSEDWPVDRAAVVGDAPFQPTAPLWASDHFGVTARITIPR